MKNQSGTIKTNLELYRVVMGGSGGYRRLPGGSAHFSLQTNRQTLHHNIYISISSNIDKSIRNTSINDKKININIKREVIMYTRKLFSTNLASSNQAKSLEQSREPLFISSNHPTRKNCPRGKNAQNIVKRRCEAKEKGNWARLNFRQNKWKMSYIENILNFIF